MAPRKKHAQLNRLSRAQCFTVAGWLDKHWHNAQRMTVAAAARRCSTDLNFTVTTFSIKDIAKATGRDFNGHSVDAMKFITQAEHAIEDFQAAVVGLKKVLGE